jgi:hypothetical protein
MLRVIVIVTGSRDFAHRDIVRAQLDIAKRDLGTPIVLRVGDCPSGADLFARAWGGEQPGPGLIEVFEADRKALGVYAGPERNARMVGAEPPAARCLAFYAPPPALNRSTSGCVALARDAGIEVREFCRTRPWSDVVAGDLVRGADGLEWAVDDAGRGSGVTLSHAGRKVTGRPEPDASVEVIARGELGRAIDIMEHAGLSPERVDTGRRNR